MIGLSWLKSNRVFSSSTSEPFCSTCSPSTCAQREVQQVRGGVVPHDVDAADRGLHAASTVSPTVQFAVVQRADVQDGVAEPLRVFDLEVDAARCPAVGSCRVSPTCPPCSP